MFLTYDVTRDETFANLSDWLKEIQLHAAEDVKIYLIGNKSEMEDQREVQFDRAVEYAKEHGIHKVFETSAKTGNNVEDLFSCSGKELFLLNEKEQKEAKNEDDKKKSTDTGGNQRTNLNKVKAGGTKKKKKGCC